LSRWYRPQKNADFEGSVLIRCFLGRWYRSQKNADFEGSVLLGCFLSRWYRPQKNADFEGSVLIRCFLSRWYRPQKTQNFKGPVLIVCFLSRWYRPRKTQNFEDMNFWLGVFWVVNIARRKRRNYRGWIIFDSLELFFGAFPCRELISVRGRVLSATYLTLRVSGGGSPSVLYQHSFQL